MAESHPLAAAPSRPVAGVLWMLASGLSFVGVNGIVRWLGTDLPAAQSAFLRFAFGTLFLLPTLVVVIRAGFAPGLLSLYVRRGMVHLVAVLLWFYAMARIPVAEVVAIGFLNPVLVTLGAALFYGEKLAARRIAAICVALLGAMIVLRPGLRELAPGHLAQVASAACFAASSLLLKRLSARASPVAIVAMVSLVVSLGLLPFAVAVWVPATAVQLALLALVAVFASVAQYCMVRAFMAAPLTVTQPVTFLQLLWGTLLGALVFGEGVDPWVLAGGLVIIGAISYITWRETVVRRRPVTPPAQVEG